MQCITPHIPIPPELCTCHTALWFSNPPRGVLPKKSSRSSKTQSHGFQMAGAHHTSRVFPHSAPAFTWLAIPTGVVCVWDEPGWEAGCYHCSRSACDFFFLCVPTCNFIARLLFHSVFYCTFYYRSLVSIAVRYQGASFSCCSLPVETGKRCPAEVELSVSGVCMVQCNLKTPGLVYSESCLQRCSVHILQKSQAERAAGGLALLSKSGHSFLIIYNLCLQCIAHHDERTLTGNFLDVQLLLLSLTRNPKQSSPRAQHTATLPGLGAQRRWVCSLLTSHQPQE